MTAPVGGAELIALLIGAAVALVTPGILRRLPPPVDEPTADPYRPLATRGFALATFVLVSAGGVLSIRVVGAQAVAWLGLTTAGVLSAMIDARTSYLPRLLTVAGWLLTAVGVAAAAVLAGDAGVAVRCLLGAIAVTALYWTFWKFAGGFGFGDVRLAPMVGAAPAVIGWEALSVALLAGSVVGVAWGVVWQYLLRRGRAFPYGPALVIGPYLALVWTALT